MKEKKIYFTKHAKKRMEERNVKEEEDKIVVITVYSFFFQRM